MTVLFHKLFKSHILDQSLEYSFIKMAEGFDIKDIDSEAFIRDQRQCEGGGGDRGMSLHIIDEVLRNSKGLFEEQGLTDDLSEKLKELWVSKLKAVDNESKKDHELLTPINKSKTSIPDSKRIVSAHRIIKRKKIEKGVSLDPNSCVNSSAKDVMCASSILGAPSSITSKQNANIGGQVDGPNDTSDEDEDIGKLILAKQFWDIKF